MDSRTLCVNTVVYQEIERAKELLEQLRTNHNIVYQQRKQRWLTEHPGQQCFNPSLEETRKDAKLEEWLWNFAIRSILIQSARFQFR